MSSSNYIRVYVNDIKVRSTGKTRYERDWELRRFGICIHALYKLHGQFQAAFSVTKPSDVKKYLELYLPAYHERAKESNCYKFRVEYVRKTKTTKKVLGEFLVPYYLIQEDGKILLRNYDFKDTVREVVREYPIQAPEIMNLEEFEECRTYIPLYKSM